MITQLESGKLYETKQGKRYRVNYDEKVDDFVCPSFSGSWDETGYANCKVGMDGKRKRPHLIREVDETRWVPIPRDDYFSESANIRMKGKHAQMRVSRETAKQIAAGSEKEKEDSFQKFFNSFPLKSDSGTVENVDQNGFKVSFDWCFEKGVITYLSIETSSGVSLNIPL